MASIRKEITVRAEPATAWDALRDFGAVHERVAPGFVVESRCEGPDRIVTFASGAQARERLVTLDDERRRVVYTVVDGPLGAAHHQASVEVLEDDDGSGGCRLIWITDVLPDRLAAPIDGMMEQGAAAIVRALDGVKGRGRRWTCC
jgi:hypothetical protein